jgi:alkylation response protein AidB-like acyl-CoA dehydrogenase
VTDGLLEYLQEDGRALAVAAREFARGELIDTDRRIDREEGTIFDVMDSMAEMGFMALVIPEDANGLGCSRITYASIIHELAYASPSAAVTLSVHNMVGKMLIDSASPRVRDALLPNWGRSENLSAFAISEADAGSDPAACCTTAVLEGDHWRINGSKMWISNGLNGRWFAVLAQAGELGDKSGLVMILVDGHQDGFERIKIQGKMGLRGSETVSLHLTDVMAPRDHVLGGPDGGLRQALTALNGGRIGIAAQSTGIAEACLDEMVAYARQRVQFRQPIARFQAIQSMISDSAVELAAAKLLIANACSGHGTSASAGAKLFASEAAGRIADRAVQVHGGTGFVNDSRVEQLYRDVRVTRIYEGTSEIQRLVIGRDLITNGVADR